MNFNLVSFLVSCAVFMFTIHTGKAGPPLQLEQEEPLFPDVVAIRPRYIMPDYHLPKQFKPTHYILRLRPIFEEGPEEQYKVPGSVVISADCINTSTNITLHINGVDIDHESVKIQDAASNLEIPRRDYSTDEENQIYIIHLNSPVEQGKKYTISITFNATAGGTSQVLGMYHRSYTKPDGQIKNLILTKLEAVGARMIFPCFDEPALKATFEVSIAHTNEYNTLCNMPKRMENISDSSLPGWYWDHYQTSVSMSTYLLAIIVSDFTSVDAVEGLYEKPVKTWAAPHHISNGGGEYGVNDTANMMKFFEILYDLKYPLPKMDSAALPGFSSGAMEQWGLITYREDYLLYFEGETTELQRRRVSEVIAHELAHQWFGNIVTMEWWDDLWLNEGFATYVEKIGLHEFHPEFESDNLIVTDDMQTSMVRDAQPNSLTVHYDGDNLSAIVYSKASCLIRMMAAFLTEETFQTAINEYLKVHSWGTAVQDGLFEILTAQGHKDGTLASDLTVKEIMDTWTRQTGFPLIMVNKVSNNRIYISQERFGRAEPLIDTAVLDPQHLWYVPISYYTETDSDFEKNQQPKFWLSKTTILANHVVDTTKWIIVNTDARGYYRVLYDNSLIAPIRAQLLANHTVFSVATRSQLIDDYLKSAFEGYIQISEGLELTKYLAKEDKLVVWTTVINNLRASFVHLTSNSLHAGNFTKYFTDKIEGALNLIGERQGANERGASVILRSQLLDWACGLKLDICGEYAQELFEQWFSSDQNVIPADLRPVLYCSMVGQLNDTSSRDRAYRFILQKYKDEAVQTSKIQLRNALACVTDENIISELLNATSIPPLTDLVTKADAVEVFKRLMANSDARDLAFQYLSDNFVTINTYHGFSGVANIVSGLAPYINERTKLTELKTFLDANSDALLGAQASINVTLNTIENNINWIRDYGQDMGEWFMRTVSTV